MKTTIDKNESQFERMKRQSFEWLEKRPTAPPFLHLALNNFHSTSEEYLTEEVRKFLDWLEEESTKSVDRGWIEDYLKTRKV